MKSTKFILAAPIVLVAVIGPLSLLQQRTKKSEIQKILYGDYEIEVIRNSDTLSQAFAITDKGSIIGNREVLDESGVILLSKCFFCGQEECEDMPVPEGFSNVEAVAVSDNDLVVGYASRRVGHEDGSLRAVVWNPKSGEIELLPPAEGDQACQAQSINSDGTRITGYTTGPQRLRPALWSRNQVDKKWEITTLETVMEYNPYLMSSSLLISPDGLIIAGCCTEKILPGDIIDSALYAWREVDGKWQRSFLSEEQMYIRGMNNRGEIAGSLLGPEGRVPCYVSPNGKVQTLGLLPGDLSGEARGINDRSQIVGWSDEPPGPVGGPKACIWNSDGVVTRLDFSDSPYAMAYDINDLGQIAGMMSVMNNNKELEESELEEHAGLALAFRTTKKVQNAK